MSVTRRGFVRRVGTATAATMTGAFITARGLEARTAAPAAGQPVPPNGGGLIRLGSNENPHGPGPHVVAAVERALRDDGNRYTRIPGDLQGRLSAMVGVGGDGLVLSAGSGDLLRAAVLAFVRAERPLVAATPTFEAPVRTAESLRLPMRLVPLTSSIAIDLPRMTEQGRGAGLVYICNPDNPTGTFQPRTAILATLDTLARTSPETIVLVDEAYFECADDPTYGSVVDQVATRPNLLVTRTFSKIHGLAGMRIGYAVAHPDTAARLRPYAGSGVVACASAAAAIASLDDTAYFAQQQAINRASRARLTQALTALGYPPVPSQANFVMVDIRRELRDFQSACRARGVLVARAFPPLETHARISFGTPDELTRAIEVFREVLA